MAIPGELRVRTRQLRRELTPDGRMRDWRLLDTKFRRQPAVGQFILDFYAPEVKLAIEVDGHFHTFEDVAAHDEWRPIEIQRFGIRLIRFSNVEVRTQMNWVLGEIADAIATCARHMTIPLHPPTPSPSNW